jgi:hypothetical protein
VKIPLFEDNTDKYYAYANISKQLKMERMTILLQKDGDLMRSNKKLDKKEEVFKMSWLSVLYLCPLMVSLRYSLVRM